MFKDFINRETAIFKTIKNFQDNELDFILVGGYAVSAYKHRFSVDADVVIKSDDLELFENILKGNKFIRVLSKDLENAYSSKFERYQYNDKLPINIDLLIGAVQSRQSGAAFSFEYINQSAEIKKIVGTEESMTVKVPCREMLISLKLHSGRLTDFRDIAAICQNIDLDQIRRFIRRGKVEVVQKNIKELLNLIDKKEFMDSFKGVFAEKSFDVDLNEIKKLGGAI